MWLKLTDTNDKPILILFGETGVYHVRTNGNNGSYLQGMHDSYQVKESIDLISVLLARPSGEGT